MRIHVLCIHKLDSSHACIFRCGLTRMQCIPVKQVRPCQACTQQLKAGKILKDKCEESIENGKLRSSMSDVISYRKNLKKLKDAHSDIQNILEFKVCVHTKFTYCIFDVNLCTCAHHIRSVAFHDNDHLCTCVCV